jgi:GNAT superfamily N-acetyltransferase
MNTVVIRPIEQEDLPHVLAMVQALAAHRGDQASVDLATLQRDVLGAVPWVRVLVAHGADGMVGYAALRPLAQVQFGRRGMDMQNLFVMPQFRGQGVGKALIKACEEHARALGCATLAVGTHPDNADAQQVYLHAGFEQRPPPGPRFGKWL